MKMVANMEKIRKIHNMDAELAQMEREDAERACWELMTDEQIEASRERMGWNS